MVLHAVLGARDRPAEFVCGMGAPSVDAVPEEHRAMPAERVAEVARRAPLYVSRLEATRVVEVRPDAIE